MMGVFETAGRFMAFALEVACHGPGVLGRPGPTLVQLGNFAYQCTGPALVVGSSIGLVSWLQLGRQFARFEAQSLLPSAILLLVVLELGPVAAGLLAAGRLASGVAAELAVMAATEQLDALRCLGVSPMRRLVVPRVLACALVLPPLALVIDASALLGAYAGEWFAGGLTWPRFWRAALGHLETGEAILATLRTAVFGGLVGMIACWCGIHATASTSGVARATTRAVVAAALAVIASNIVLVQAIHRLG